MPQPEGQMINATVTAQSRLQTPEQFRNIIVKSEPSGARVLLGDVARVELGAENYAARIRATAIPARAWASSSSPARTRFALPSWSRQKVEEIAPRMPAGYRYAYANDTTDFIKLSIKEVVKTLLEAIVLVVLVMFVFLQSWRATLIPFIAVPVVLLGTFAILYALGFSINTMTLFGLVLATGLLVDDAIVVVENVERLMHENPEMTPREATIISMGQIQMALVAIALVLSAVFLPMVFFGGSTGRHLPPVLGDHRLGDGAVGFHRADAEPGDRREPAQAQSCDGRGDLAWAASAPRLAHAIERGRLKFNAASTDWSNGTSGPSAGSSTASGCFWHLRRRLRAS